jgi:4-alpha-glucanotransferase
VVAEVDLGTVVVAEADLGTVEVEVVEALAGSNVT